MTLPRLVITGVGAISGAGRGPGRVLLALREGRTAIRAGLPYPADGLANPRAASVDGVPRDRPAEALLDLAVSDALAASGRAPAGVGLVVGTSSGNRCGPWERWHRELLAGRPGDEAACGRETPTEVAAARFGLDGPRATVSVACASGTAALAVASGWLWDARCAAVVAAGVDALSLFVHAGFGGLGALCADLPHPFRADRDGLALGEGAAALVIEPLDAAVARGAPLLAELRGAGLSCDARHMTAPHREGRGVAAAIGAALAEAALTADPIDLVSVHGTGTRYNDAMEAHALRAVFGARPLAVHAVKGVVGHLLGAAGALECVEAVHALATGTWPAPLTDVDPELPWAPDPVRSAPPATAVVTSSAFGGINAAVVLAVPDPARRPAGPVEGVEAVEVADVSVTLAPGQDLGSVWPQAPPRASRVDRSCKVALWAVSSALTRLPSVPEATGVVLWTRHGCREADLAHHQRVVLEGPARASRLWFAATVPSAPASEAAVAFGLRGPQLVFVGGDDIAAAEAARLIRHRRATCVVALTCDAPDPERPATARARVLLASPTALRGP